MIVDCALYRDGQRQNEGPMELERSRRDLPEGRGVRVARAVRARRGRAGRRAGPIRPARSRGRGRSELPPAPEDRALRRGRACCSPCFRTARYVEDREEVDVGEVSVFISRRFVITVRQGEASDLHGARLRLEERPELLKEGPAAVLWAILDTIVDDYAPVIEGLERDVEEVETTVFSGAAAPTERIYLLRREATDFYRAVHPLLAPLDGLERGAYLQVSEELSSVLPRRQRSPQARQRGGHRAARRARHDPPGEHGGHLQPAERDQRPPERDHEAADARRHDLPAR